MSEHDCRGADHISNVAFEHRLCDWHTLWEFNAELRSRRANPNLLFKGPALAGGGDVLRIPSRTREETFATGNDHECVRKVTEPLVVRLRILDEKLRPLPAECRFRIGSREESHPTNDRGEVSVRVPPKTRSVDLVARPPGQSVQSFRLRIGALNPILELAPDERCLSGVQQRLNNLGFVCGDVTGTWNEATRAAIAAFRWTYGLGDSDEPDFAMQEWLRRVHDGSGFAPRRRIHECDPAFRVEESIGHVAPDFEMGTFFNALRFSGARYRISLDFGDWDALFPPVASNEGRMARMQVLGLFYCPLDHSRREELFAMAWTWFKEKTLGGVSDAVAAEALVGAVRTRIVSGDRPPAWFGAERSRLPKPGESARIRVPGAYTPMDDGEGPSSTGTCFDAEKRIRQSNEALGRIPLAATVQEQETLEDEWTPVQMEVRYSANLGSFSGSTFLPSLGGGDEHRVRASLTAVDAFAETGTLVVWRNIRISRHLWLEPGSPHRAYRNIDWDRVAARFAKSFGEIEVEGFEVLSEAELQTMRAHVSANLEESTELGSDDGTLIPLRFENLDVANSAADLAMEVLGGRPGLTCVQAVDLTSSHLEVRDGELGRAFPYSRAFFLGPDSPTDDRLHDCVAHEIGHLLFLQHAPGGAGARPYLHDDELDGSCLMSPYERNIGFCSRCVRSHRAAR